MAVPNAVIYEVEVAEIIAEALIADAGADLSGLRTRVQALAAAHPLYPGVSDLAG